MKYIFTVIIVLLFSVPVFCTAEKGREAVTATAKCPVCGMFIAKYPDWTAVARFRDGSISYFDGPKDLFTYYFDPVRYTPGKRQSDITSLQVKEYYSLGMIDPKTAFFVIGSDIHGPMGNELVPFKSEKDAVSFKQDHKGKRIIRFNDLTRPLIQSIN